MGGNAIEAVQFELVGEGGRADQAAELGWAHFVGIGDAHVAGDDRANVVDEGVGSAQALQDGAGHVRADGGVVFEAPALRAVGQRGEIRGGRLADVVQEDGQREAQGRVFGHGIEHEFRMREDVAFGVEFGGLFHADERLDFGQDFLEQSSVAQELEGLAGPGRFGQQPEQFVADALGADAADLGCEFLDGGEGGGVDGKAQNGCEAHRAQQA